MAHRKNFRSFQADSITATAPPVTIAIKIKHYRQRFICRAPLFPASARAAWTISRQDQRAARALSTGNVNASATLVISPVRPSLFDLLALKDTIKLVEPAGKLDATVCVVNGIAPGRGQGAADSEAELAASGLGIKVAPPYLCQRAAYVKAIGLGKRVTEIKPKNEAAKEIRAGGALEHTQPKREEADNIGATPGDICWTSSREFSRSRRRRRRRNPLAWLR